jgi:hypothetical protein
LSCFFSGRIGRQLSEFAKYFLPAPSVTFDAMLTFYEGLIED